MPKNNSMYKLLIFLLLCGCLQTHNTEGPSAPSPLSSKQINATFSKNLNSIKAIDARVIYKAKFIGDFSNSNQINITFLGRDRPSLRFYKHEIKSGMEFTIIPPKGSMNQVKIENIGKDFKTISKVLKKLKSGETTTISL